MVASVKHCVVTAVGRGGRSSIYMANRMRKATIKQKRPIASDRANPKIAYENNCCFRDGFLQERRRGEGSRHQISVMKLAMSLTKDIGYQKCDT